MSVKDDDRYDCRLCYLHNSNLFHIRPSFANRHQHYRIRNLSIFTSCIICFVVSTANPVFSQGYTFESEWGGPGTSFGSFSQPQGIAVDSLGNVYVTDFTALANQVQKFTNNGTFITAWGFLGFGAGLFTHPAGIAVDLSNDNVYVTDFGSAEMAVQKFTSDGNYVNGWGSLGLGQGQFINPAGVAVDSQGNIYVSDFGENNEIKKFTGEGDLILEWGTPGTEDGQFIEPTSVAVDETNDYVYVLDQGNNRVMGISW